MNNELKIFNSDVIPVYETDTGNKVVIGRELYENLKITERYSKWFARMAGYGFEENQDYTPYQMVHPQNHQKIDDYILTLDMAKHIAMIQRTPQGMEIRQKLIDLEKKVNNGLMVEALCNPDSVIQLLTAYSAEQKKTAELTAKNAELEPKGKYFDDLVDANSLMNFTDTAKALKISRKKMLDVLVKEKYLYRQGSHGKLIPYEKNNNGYFEVKEQKNAFGSWAGPQTFVTVAGRQLLLRMLDEGYFD